ncbi:protein lifeguard 2-like [Rhynchophorus ferrugineus]|uniref:protein lifeguard 2-like n=1 Tax=Rhynchophorus ferrugineus TaxID=354439 RepID=UPI003FCE35F6
MSEINQNSSDNDVRQIALKQINEVIEIQQPSSSKSYSVKTEIRIGIVEQATKEDDDDSVISLSLFGNDQRNNIGLVEEDESYATVDACLKEKTTTTTGLALYTVNERAQRAGPATNEAPPPYETLPPAYSRGGYHQSPNQIQVFRQPQSNQAGSWDPPSSDYMVAFLLVEIRQAFVRKVFFLLALQLLFTAGFVTFVMNHEPTRLFVLTNRSMFWVMFVVWTMLYFVMMCCAGVRRAFPLNFILLLMFTIAMSYICATVTVVYSTMIVMLTLACTAAICLLVTILAFQTWFDITRWSFILSFASVILLVFGIVIMIVFLFTYSRVLWLVYSGLATALFSLFLLYDMQCILGGRRHEISPEEYIFAALTLYVDVVMIFMYMLELLNACT